MRIGVLTTSYPREPGDPAGEFVAGFARWLARHAEVEVVCAAGARRLFYRGGAPLALAQRRWPEALLFSARLMAEAAWRASRWDAVVSHWLVPCGAVGMVLRRPHLAIAHGSDVRLLQKLPAGRQLARKISRQADLVYVADHLRIDGAPGRVVPMGVDAAAWRGGDRARARAKLGLERYTVLFLGRLIRDKGADRAIDALPDGAELLIAGDGPERAALERQATRQAKDKRVRFLGEVRGEAKRDLFAAADVMVVPSRVEPRSGRIIEGAPTVLAEAAAAGLPVVPVENLCEPCGRSAPSDRYDWSVIGPRLAARLPLGGGSGSVHVKRV